MIRQLILVAYPCLHNCAMAESAWRCRPGVVNFGFNPQQQGAAMLVRRVGLFISGAFLCSGLAMAQSMPKTAMITADLSGGDRVVTISAQNLNDAAPGAASVGRRADGIGASGRQASAPTIQIETGFDPVAGRSERLLFAFATPVSRAELQLGYFYAAEAEIDGAAWHERGQWRAYAGEQQIDQGQFTATAADGAYHLTIAPHSPFERLEILATPYVNDAGEELGPGKISTDSSDFLVSRLAYQPATIP